MCWYAKHARIGENEARDIGEKVAQLAPRDAKHQKYRLNLHGMDG